MMWFLALFLSGIGIASTEASWLGGSWMNSGTSFMARKRVQPAVMEEQVVDSVADAYGAMLEMATVPAGAALKYKARTATDAVFAWGRKDADQVQLQEKVTHDHGYFCLDDQKKLKVPGGDNRSLVPGMEGTDEKKPIFHKTVEDSGKFVLQYKKDKLLFGSGKDFHVITQHEEYPELCGRDKVVTIQHGYFADVKKEAEGEYVGTQDSAFNLFEWDDSLGVLTPHTGTPLIPKVAVVRGSKKPTVVLHARMEHEVSNWECFDSSKDSLCVVNDELWRLTPLIQETLVVPVDEDTES